MRVARPFWPATASFVLFSLGLSFVASAAISVEKNTVLALSNHPQLFLDDYLLAKMDHLKRVIQQPTKYLDNPLRLEPEYAWEQSRMDLGSVIYDEQRKKFRMWYTVLMDKSKYADNFGYVCHAESQDGIRWHKPMMKIHDFEGRLPTNIVSKGPSMKNSECLFPNVIKTPHDPARLYKMLFTHRSGNISHHGLNVMTSQDGLIWTKPKRVYQGKCDNPPCLVWSGPLGKYFGFCRAQDSHKALAGHIRSTGILTSMDFDHWTSRKKVVITDERDGYPFTQFHHLMVTQYGDLMIGLADVMHMTTNDNKLSTEDVQLICSRDGWNWHRVADRAVFIPNGPQGYDRAIVSPRSSLVVKDDTIYIYYEGKRFGQGLRNRKKEIAFFKAGGSRRDAGGACLATLPADRFVALVPSSEREGVLQTMLLKTSGRQLLVNAQLAKADDLQVELLDAKGNVLPGYGRGQSRLVVHDKLRYHVRWEQKGENLPLKEAVDKQPVALRFILRRGALFAFQMVE